MRLFVILGLILGVAYAEEPESIQLVWQGGTLPLSEAADWLSEGGNETVIELPKASPSGDKKLEFPFSSGSYWEGVVATMEHHELALARGSKSINFHRSQNLSSGIQHPIIGISPVKLIDAEQPINRGHFIPCGPVLLEIKDARISHYLTQQKTSMEIGYFAHLEPRFSLNDIGYVALMWKPLGSGDTVIQWPSQLNKQQRQRSFSQIGSYQGQMAPNVIRSQSDSILQLDNLDLQATCEIVFTELRTNEVTLNVGESATFHMDKATAEWSLSLLTPSERQPRYHQLVLEAPSSDRYQGAIKIEGKDQEGKRVHSSGRTTNWASQQEKMKIITYLQAPKSLPITFRVEVRAVTGRESHNISSRLDFPSN